MSEFDYIIVGAGSAGCVLANKLGADTSKSILILEAGPMDHNLMIHIPAGVYSAWRNPKLNWNYDTEAEKFIGDRPVFMPRGRVVGGSSSINSMVYMRGHPMDYDGWAKGEGMEQWAYEHCLPYFKSSESYNLGGNDYRGANGPLGVTRSDFDNPLIDAFLEAGVAAGQGKTDDPNGYNPEGVSRLDATKKNGRRCSAAVAHLRPALRRGNVTLLTHAMVHRIATENGRATGVDFSHKSGQRHIKADQIILSGGAINSPQLLMLSGIGPADHLRNHGIEIVQNLPGVGQNLQDHPSVILQFESLKSYPIHKVDQPHRKLATGMQWVFTRKGLASSSIFETGGVVRGNETVPHGNLQYHFAPIGFEYSGNKISVTQAFLIHVDTLRPNSRGNITLKSADPTEKPAMLFNYMSGEGDMQEMIEGVKKARELVAQAPYDGLRGQEIDPSASVKTDDDIRAWISAQMVTDFHPCGTCKMGMDANAVVDPELRVHGIKGLRVVDASAMPKIVSGNLNAPTQMIAARAADMIANNPPLPPERPIFAFDT